MNEANVGTPGTEGRCGVGWELAVSADAGAVPAYKRTNHAALRHTRPMCHEDVSRRGKNSAQLSGS
jgi:hypothetical protein